MSVQTLYTAATGMDSLQQRLDTIANNLANINTDGYKASRANFQDLFYRQEMLPGIQDQQGNFTPTGIAIGLGVRVRSTQTDFSQGAFKETNRPLDVAIVGEGFFQVLDPPTGQLIYTRTGSFNLNSNGQMVIGSALVGRQLEPAIPIPPDATNVTIGPNGIVSVLQPGQQNLTQVGQIQLVKFINPEGLLKLGENLYQQTDASGPPVLTDNPGNQGLGTLQQNVIEASNVEPVSELIDLITTQRAFELNSQVVQAGDQILQLISTLRRF
jgi:flagellar basal-body rod protein FlgG